MPQVIILLGYNQMIRLKYFFDESVQSWIYRNINVSGSSDLSTVIAPKGGWRVYPSFHKDSKFDVNILDDRDFLAFLRRSGLANKYANFFENPVDYLSDMERIFDQRIEPLKSASVKRPIRYCRYCIKEMIKANGFAYFKSYWLTESECSVHTLPLHEIKALGYKDNKVLIRQILEGKNIPKSFIGEAKKEDDVISNNNDIKLHMMPCFQRDLYNWALSERRHYMRGMSHRDFYYQDGRRKPALKKGIYETYYFYLHQRPDLLEEFFAATHEIIKFKFGFAQRLSLKENLLKSKHHDCTKCNFWGKDIGCPIQPIALKPLDSDASFYNWNNPCDLFMEFEFKMNNQYFTGSSDCYRPDFVGMCTPSELKLD